MSVHKQMGAEIQRLRSTNQEMADALKEIGKFAREHPWTGLGDAKDYGDGKLLARVKAALAKAQVT